MKTIKTLSMFFLAVLLFLSSSFCMFACADATTGTITVSNVLPGTVYRLYRVFDASYTVKDGQTYMAYTLDAGTDSGAKLKAAVDDSASPFTAESTSETNIYQIKRKDSVTDAAVTEWLNDQITNLEYVSEQTGGTNGTLSFTGMTFGYYLVNSVENTTTSAVSITNLAPDAAIIDKNPRSPSPVTKVSKTTAEIGEEVEFTVSFKAVNFYTENKQSYRIYEYVLDDTSTYLDPLGSAEASVFGDSTATASVKLYTKYSDNIYSGEITDPAVSYKTTYTAATAAAPAKRTLTIAWGTSGTEATGGTSYYPENTYVVITYKMKVTGGTYAPAAADGTATFSAAVNSVTESFRMNAVSDPKVINTATAKVKTTGFSITKVDAATSTLRLTGAKFKLYKLDGSTKKYWKNTGTNNMIDWVSFEDATEVTADNNDLTAEFFGLGAGTYYLTETYAPSGYYLPTSDFTVVVTAPADDTSDPTVTVGGINATAGGNGIPVGTVTNAIGFLLPTAGGIGTTVFYIAGGAVFVAAIVLLITKKRMDR